MQDNQPLYTARSVLDAFYIAESKYMAAPESTRDFSVLAAVLSPDFVMEQTSGLPWAGTYKGPQGMQSWMEIMAEWFDRLEVRDPEIFEKEGADRIAVLSNVLFRVRKTGAEVEYPLAQAITVDLVKGQIKMIRPFYWDVTGLNKLLGYEPGK